MTFGVRINDMIAPLLSRLTLFCLMLAPLSVNASDITASHRQAAQDFLEASGVRTSMRDTQQVLVSAMMQPLQKLPCIDDRAEAELKDLVLNSVSYDTLKDEFVGIYAATFTEAELKELTAFNRSPLGQKALSEMPKLMQQSIAIGQQAAIDNEAAVRVIISKYINDDGSCTQH